MPADDRNSEYDNLTVTDSFTDPGGTEHTGAIGGGGGTTGVDVENTNGTALVAGATAIHAGTDLAFTDDADGTATLDYTGTGGGTTGVDVENVDGTTLVAGATAIHADFGVSFADDSDGTASLSVDEAITPTWTGDHTFSYTTGDHAVTFRNTGGDMSVDIDAPGANGNVPRIRFFEGGNDRWAIFVDHNDTDLTIFDYDKARECFAIDFDSSVVVNQYGTAYEQRGDATAADLTDGDCMIYNSNGTGVGDAGDLVYAVNNAGTISSTVLTGETTVTGSVTLSGGTATVATGVTTTPTYFDIALDPSGNGANAADVKTAARAFWDNTAGEYKIEVLEDGTDVGNPTIGYVVTIRD